MPDFYAHQVFGALVYNALPEPLRARLAPERPGYYCGLYGPDPLFFYRPLHSNPVSREGHELHRCPPGTVLERFHTAETQNIPYALGYAVGFLTHYLLDCACHPIVNAFSAGSSLRHTALEGAFDRLLTPSGQTGLPLVPPRDKGVYIAAAIGYRHAGAEQLALALRRFCQVSRVIAWFRRLTVGQKANRTAAEALKNRMLSLVPQAAALAERLVETLDRGETPDFLPTLDFNGLETGEVAISAGV